MRENRVKQALRSGGSALGVMCMEFATTGIGPISAAAGAEFLVLDMEHTGWGLETVKMLAATARGAGAVPIVRVPTLDYHFIAHALDAGAMGIVVPLVGNAEQARFAVECAMYPPRGRRGCAFGMAHDDYAGGDPAEKVRGLNEQVLMIAQIETSEGLANVEAIAAVEGIDALWIGQYDLTTSLGIPGRFDHPQFHDATRRVLDACAAHGKAAGLGVFDADALAAGATEGYRLFVFVADLWIYQQALARGIKTVRAAMGPPSGAGSP